MQGDRPFCIDGVPVNRTELESAWEIRITGV